MRKISDLKEVKAFLKPQLDVSIPGRRGYRKAARPMSEEERRAACRRGSRNISEYGNEITNARNEQELIKEKIAAIRQALDALAPLGFLFKAQKLRECLAPKSGKGRLPPNVAVALRRAARFLRRYYAALAAEIERLAGLAWDLVSGEAQRRLLAQIDEMKRERAELERQYEKLDRKILNRRNLITDALWIMRNLGCSDL